MIGMDETPCWLEEPVGETSIDVIGAKVVPAKTIGHEKIVAQLYCLLIQMVENASHMLC